VIGSRDFFTKMDSFRSNKSLYCFDFDEPLVSFRHCLFENFHAFKMKTCWGNSFFLE
jgi:hypothetical protein